MDELDASFQQVGNIAEVTSNKANELYHLSQEGNLIVQQTLESISNFKGRIETVSTQILRLSEQTIQI